VLPLERVKDKERAAKGAIVEEELRKNLHSRAPT